MPKILYIILITLSLIDIVTTWIIVCEYGGVEWNKVIKELVETFGFVPIASFRIAFYSFIYFYFRKIMKRKYFVLVLLCLIVVSLFAVVNNLISMSFILNGIDYKRIENPLFCRLI